MHAFVSVSMLQTVLTECSFLFLPNPIMWSHASKGSGYIIIGAVVIVGKNVREAESKFGSVKRISLSQQSCHKLCLQNCWIISVTM